VGDWVIQVGAEWNGSHHRIAAVEGIIALTALYSIAVAGCMQFKATTRAPYSRGAPAAGPGDIGLGLRISESPLTSF